MDASSFKPVVNIIIAYKAFKKYSCRACHKFTKSKYLWIGAQAWVLLFKKLCLGNSLAISWLELRASTAGGTGSIPGR